MRTLMINVCDLETTKARMLDALAGRGSDDVLSFPSEELLFTVLTARRWPVLRALTGAGPVGVRALARQLGRDVKGTHTDAQALVKAGVIEKTVDGKLHFPYDAVRIELGWRAAA
ncbi:transcriptional regulator [uncultured Lamprocystis sp.]|jgi:predicted transcriptional regulator|uniref:HVO_A0114 family putative DNA-binding protein n=1 Tax=uncultured Lamprocystis sp. TaxID=543132 RepID=UPI0025DFE9DB|nr:transcriptional regulator [uncultured Lamprocystis sp.]